MNFYICVDTGRRISKFEVSSAAETNKEKLSKISQEKGLYRIYGNPELASFSIRLYVAQGVVRIRVEIRNLRMGCQSHCCSETLDPMQQ
jgi:hypothetical protein